MSDRTRDAWPAASQERGPERAHGRPQPIGDEALLEVLAQFDSLLDGAPLGIGIFDRDLRHVRVNTVLEQMNGRPASQLLGRTAAEINGEVGRQAEVLYRQVMESGVAMRDVRLTGEVSARPGEVRHWSTTFHPVRSGGEVIGLCVIVDDVTAEQDLADALADSRRAYQRLAEELQRDLLPPARPVVPGADVAAVYRPARTASAVGGDFYDVIEVDDHRWLLIIGDVQGKGPLAASLSGAVRYAIRTAAVVDPDPARVMATVNDVLMRLENDRTCTAAGLLLERHGVGWSVHAASAGHPAPLVVRGESGATPARVEGLGVPGMLLGVVPGTRYDVAVTSLSPGDSLVLYTDGVTEARAPRDAATVAAITLFGESRLRAVLTDAHAREAAAGPGARSVAGSDAGTDRASRLAESVNGAVEAFSAGELRDDLTLLVFHVAGPPE